PGGRGGPRGHPPHRHRAHRGPLDGLPAGRDRGHRGRRDLPRPVVVAGPHPPTPGPHRRARSAPVGGVTAPPPRPAAPSGRTSTLVAAGILASRVAGVLREVVIAAFLGTTPARDAFAVAMRVPNFLQNLLGE